MLFHLTQIAAVSVVCLSLLLESKLCTAAPCLDLYEDVERPAVYNIDEIEDVSPIFGLSHKTISGMHHHGTKQLETLVPGTAIPPHTHGGEEVVIALKGTATFNSRDPEKQVHAELLRSNDTITILPGLVHSFSNMGDEDVQLLVALAGDLHPMIYPRWGADASEAQRMEPLAFDQKCPTKVPKSLHAFQNIERGRDEL